MISTKGNGTVQPTTSTPTASANKTLNSNRNGSLRATRKNSASTAKRPDSGDLVVVDGRLEHGQARERSAEEPTLTLAPKASQGHFWSWPVEHYKAGLISGLLLFDVLALT